MFVIDGAARSDLAPAGAEASVIRGRELAGLDATSLGARFYSWRSGPGERCVCTIFRAEEEELVAGFARAVVIGVAREDGQRRPVCVLASEHFRAESGRRARETARSLGVNEWHVRFCPLPGELARRLARALLS